MDVLVAAFFMGLMGAGPCLGMCGGILAALSFALPAGAFARKIALLSGYSLGRILSYSLIGLFVGLLGWGLAEFSSGGHFGGSLGYSVSYSLSYYMRLFAGVLLIALGFYTANWWRGLLYVEKAGAGVWRLIKPVADKLLPVKTFSRAVMLGALWGWLPCGLVYTALAYAMANSMASPINGALIMFAFGLGTLPAVLMGGAASRQLLDVFKRRSVRIVMSVGYIAFGIFTIFQASIHSSHSHHSSHIHQPLHDAHSSHSESNADNASPNADQSDLSRPNNHSHH